MDKKFITLSLLLTFAFVSFNLFSALGPPYKQTVGMDDRFYELFKPYGTEVITETIKYKDDFGDNQERFNHYFVADNIRFQVEVVNDACPEYEYYKKNFLKNRFPFRISTKFNDYLNYETSGLFAGHVQTKYKLSDGTKGDYWQGTVFSKSGMKWFTMRTPKDSPLALNMVAYKKQFQADRKADRRDPSIFLNGGELTIVIKGKSDPENITFTFNPFHKSWLSLYLSHCNIDAFMYSFDFDTSGADIELSHKTS